MMEYNVFVSHSMKQEDLAIVYAAVQDAAARGISCYIAERDWQLGQSLPAKIETHIRNCDCFVAFLTAGGAQSQWVQQEIGCAVGSNRPRILVVEQGVQVTGFDIGKEYITLDRWNPWQAVATLNNHLSQLKNEKGQQQNAGLVVLGVIALIALLRAK